MRRLSIAAISFFLLLIGRSGYGQNLGLGAHIGLKAGMALTVLDGQINRTALYKKGFSGGLMLRVRPSKGIAVQPEVLFVQQGTGNSLSRNGSSPDYKINLGYVNVPVLLKVYIGSAFNIQVGPQIGWRISAHEVGQTGTTANGTAVIVDRDVAADYYPVDFAVVGGVGVDLPLGLVASARINYGFSDINNNAANARDREVLGIGGLHNRGFEFSIGYLIGANK